METGKAHNTVRYFMYPHCLIDSEFRIRQFFQLKNIDSFLVSPGKHVMLKTCNVPYSTVCEDL